MTEVSVQDVWMEYGDQIVLERIRKEQHVEPYSLTATPLLPTQSLTEALCSRNTPCFHI